MKKMPFIIDIDSKSLTYSSKGNKKGISLHTRAPSMDLKNSNAE